MNVSINDVPLVAMRGNRACLTDQVVMEFPETLRRWVENNCDRDPSADVWLLPVPEKT